MSGRAAAAGDAAPAPAPIRIIPATRWGHWIGIAAVTVFAAWIAYQVLTNPGFQWHIVGRYMLHPRVLDGHRRHLGTISGKRKFWASSGGRKSRSQRAVS